MQAFQDAMADGGDIGVAFEAMGDMMGPIMQDMGVSPEAFDAAGDVFGAAIGGGMHMGPADAGGPEMGAMMQDAATMMMPPGTEVPAPIMDAMADMGQGFSDAGCAPHDMASEMMPPPGDPGYPFPCDAAGVNTVPPGDPAACPSDVCQAPPVDGACADMGGNMMPPEGGYDHAPMPADAAMAPPMDMGNMETVDPFAPVADDPMDGMAPNMDPMADGGGMAPNMDPMADGDGMGALGDALGGSAGNPPPADMGNTADAAIGAAMDGAMDQGGAPQTADAGAANAGDPAADVMDDTPEVDPSAGMG
jgi:hypothetical protein